MDSLLFLFKICFSNKCFRVCGFWICFLSWFFCVLFHSVFLLVILSQWFKIRVILCICLVWICLFVCSYIAAWSHKGVFTACQIIWCSITALFLCVCMSFYATYANEITCCSVALALTISRYVELFSWCVA